MGACVTDQFLPSRLVVSGHLVHATHPKARRVGVRERMPFRGSPSLSKLSRYNELVQSWVKTIDCNGNLLATVRTSLDESNEIFHETIVSRLCHLHLTRTPQRNCSILQLRTLVLPAVCSGSPLMSMSATITQAQSESKAWPRDVHYEQSAARRSTCSFGVAYSIVGPVHCHEVFLTV